MKKLVYSILFCLFVFAFLFFKPLSSQAAVVEITNPLGVTSLQDLIAKIVAFIYKLALVVAPVMFIIAGFIFVTSAGQPDRVRTAKNIFLYTLVGLVIILLASSFYYVLKSILGG